MIDYTFPMLVGEDEVACEQTLTSKVEAGLTMESPSSVRFIVIHCSATRADRDYTVEQMMRDHKARGFRTIGYHAYIRRDGTVTYHRHWLEVGAHAKPYNRCSIGICYEGGIAVEDSVIRNVDCGMKTEHPSGVVDLQNEKSQNSKSKISHSTSTAGGIIQHSTLNTQNYYCDTRTPAQMEQLLLLLMKLKKMFPKAKIVGHRDLPGTTPKECPCFDATSEYASL